MLAMTGIKRDIGFNKEFHSFLHVLQLVAIAKFRLLEKELKLYEAFEAVLTNFFLSFDLKSIRHPFLDPGDRPSGIVAVTSDQGLLGGLNKRAVNTAMGLMQSGRDELIIIGEQGQRYAHECRTPFTGFPGIRDVEKEEQAEAVQHYLFGKAQEGAFGTLKVVYPRALSIGQQRVEVATFLPYSGMPEERQAAPPTDLSETILESSLEGVLEYLIFLLIGQRLKEIFGMSRLAEMGARYLHLEECSHNLEEINRKLQLRYFRLRHEVIDQTLRELFSARVNYGG